MLQFDLNYKSNVLDWAKAHNIPIDYDKAVGIAEYMEFEPMPSNKSFPVFAHSEAYDYIVEGKTFRQDAVDVKILKMILSTGKAKAYKLHLEHMGHDPKYDGSGNLISKGKFFYYVNRWKRTARGIDEVMTLFFANVKPCFVLDRANHAAYFLVTCDDLQAVEKEVAQKIEQAQNTKEKAYNAYCKLTDEIHSLDVKRKKPWDEYNRAKTEIFNLSLYDVLVTRGN